MSYILLMLMMYQVSMQQLPRYPKARPDFQAPGPRVLIEKDINLEDEQESLSPMSNDEVDEVNSYGPPKVRYYESQKILGKLYRAIDEHQFLAQIQAQTGATALKNRSLIEKVWQYVNDKTRLIQWRHHIDFAENAKEK